MTVSGYDPHMSVESAWRVSNQVQRVTNLEELLATSDYITLHLPLIDSTQHLLDERLLAKVKQGATLLNFSRGELIDEHALATVLKSGRLANYVTDFPNAFILSLAASDSVAAYRRVHCRGRRKLCRHGSRSIKTVSRNRKHPECR